MGTTTDTLLTVVKLDGVAQYASGWQQMAGAQKAATAEEAAWSASVRRRSDALAATAANYSRYSTMFLGIGAGFLGAGAAAVKAAADIERLSMQMETATQSAQRGRQLMGWARETSYKVPFSIEQVTAATVRLEMFGQAAQTWFPKVADMAGSMGGDVEEAAGAVAAALSGSPMGVRRLRRYGIGPMQLKAAGWTGEYGNQEGLRTMGTALGSIMDTRFAGGTERMMSTLQGQLTNLKAVFRETSVGIGEMLMPQVKGLTQGVISLGTWIKDLSPVTKQSIASLIQFGAVGGILGGVTMKVYSLVLQYQAYNAMKSLAATALRIENIELERQNFLLGKNNELRTYPPVRQGLGAAYMARPTGLMGAVGAGLLGGAIGAYMGPNIAAENNTGMGMAKAGGTVVAGALAGSMFGPWGTVIGALAALGVAAYGAGKSIDTMSKAAATGTTQAMNQFPSTWIAASRIQEGAALKLGATERTTNDAGEQGYVVPSANVPHTMKALRDLGIMPSPKLNWWEKAASRGFAGPIGVGALKASQYLEDARLLQEWESATTGAGKPRSLRKGPTEPEEADTSALKAAATERARFMFSGALKEFPRGGGDITGTGSVLTASIEAEKAAITEELAVLKDEYDALVQNNDAKGANAKATEYAKRELDWYKLSQESAAVATDTATAAIERQQQRMSKSQTAVGQYIELMKQMGVPTMDPRMQQAYQYQQSLGLQQAAGATSYEEYIGGILGATQAGNAMRGSKTPMYGMGPVQAGQVFAPWQYGALDRNNQQPIMYAPTIYVQTPAGLMRAYVGQITGMQQQQSFYAPSG